MKHQAIVIGDRKLLLGALYKFIVTNFESQKSPAIPSLNPISYGGGGGWIPPPLEEKFN